MGLFKDSLKKWFYTNNTSAASSDARVPLLDASGNPKGSDTMDNLASVLGENVFFGGGEVKQNTKFEDIPLGINYYGNPNTAPDVPIGIIQQYNNQCIVIKRGSSPSMIRGLMVVINKHGIAVKFKGDTWDENWTYLITL